MIGENRYRYYDDEALLRLQQILFFRELDFSLESVKDIIDTPGFDTIETLEEHRQALQERSERLQRLIRTVDRTIMYLNGVSDMNTHEMFDGFTEEQEKEYQAEAGQRWGNEAVDSSYKHWNSYSAAQKAQIRAEGESIYTDICTKMEKGYDSPEVQQCIARWHQSLRYFYEPTPDILLGLAQMYKDDSRFASAYRKLHPALPEFLHQAIEYYCHGLANRGQGDAHVRS